MVADDTFSEGGQSAGQYFSAEQQRGGATPGPNLGEALDGGIQYIMSNFGMRQGGVPNPQAGAALARGEGALTPQEMQQVRATVDPENKMDDALANIYALDALYQHYLKKGDPRKAQAAAASLMMYTMRHAAARGAQAQQEQDPNKRAQLIADGYNAIPNGKKVEPSVGPNGTGQFTVKDARTGQVVQQGQYSPEQLAAAALGLRDGSVYWQSIMQAAGVRGEKPPTAQQQRQQNLQEFQQTGALDLQPEGQTAPIDGDNPPPNAGDEMDGQGAQLPKSAPPRMYRDALDEEQKQKFDALPNTDKNRLQREWSTRIKTQETAAKQKIEDERKARGEATRPMPVGDRTKSEEATNTAVDEVLPEEPAKGQKAVEPAARSTIKSGAYAIFTHAGNGNISATEAARAAAAIAGQTPGDPPQVKVEGDQALVRLKNGRVIRIPTSALTDLAAYQKKSKTVASDEGPSGLRRLGESSIPFGVGAGINVARGAIGAATNPKVQETLKKFYNTPSPPRVSNYPNEREVRARGGILNPEAKRRALGVD